MLPVNVIQKLPQIKSVVIVTIGLTMIRGCESGHLVSVNSVKLEKSLYFSRDFPWSDRVCTFLIGDSLPLLRPNNQKLLEHLYWSTPINLPKFPILIKLFISHSHLYFVELLWHFISHRP